MGASDQSTKTTSQNYSIEDIDKIYNDWIKSIDSIRSYANFNNKLMKNILGSSIDVKANLASLNKAVKIESSFQESRCHAFYRWIGFPVVHKNKELFYSPGFDIVNCKTSDIDLLYKLMVAKNPIDKFELLSDSRENFFQHNLKIFSSAFNITASTVALSSGGTKKLRKFNSPFEGGDDPFNMDVDKQNYTIDIDSVVGEKTVSLYKYKDSGGNTPDPKELGNRSHIIKPFLVDGRIDFSVYPQSNLVAVPFVSNDSHLKISSTKMARRPLIEKYIRSRAPVNDINSASGTYIDKIKEYIDKETLISNRQLIDAVRVKSNLFKSQNDQDQFIDTINIIIAMVRKLDWAEKYIRKAQSFYYWVPYPSAIGPEGGSKVQPVFLLQYIDSDEKELITEIEQKIRESQMKAATNNQNIESATVTAAPPDSAFGLFHASDPIDMSATTTAALGDNNKKNLDALVQTRNRELEGASEALRTIEIIMGEFSGLGLCDIVAITGALKILPMSSLCGLLDDNAFERMKKALPTLKEIKQDSLETSLTAFTSLVKDFYNIMDSIYKNVKETAKY